jgi:hypothetical protein
MRASRQPPGVGGQRASRDSSARRRCFPTDADCGFDGTACSHGRIGSAVVWCWTIQSGAACQSECHDHDHGVRRHGVPRPTARPAPCRRRGECARRCPASRSGTERPARSWLEPDYGVQRRRARPIVGRRGRRWSRRCRQRGFGLCREGRCDLRGRARARRQDGRAGGRRGRRRSPCPRLRHRCGSQVRLLTSARAGAENW